MANGEHNHRLSDFIVVIRGLASQEKCNEIINLYKDHELIDWASTTNGMNLDHRKVKQLWVSSQPVTSAGEKFVDADKDIFNIMKKAKDIYAETLVKKRNISHIPQINSDEGYQFLHYSEGYYFKQHVDNFPGAARVLTCTLNLNSDYDGGLFRFLSGEFDVSLGAGDAVVFPSNFMFPHEVTEITSGDRFSIVTWFQ
jgi:hypothetical protein